jgi:hypothetical protein
MAITTLDGLLAGMKAPAAFTKATFTGEAAGQWHNLAALAGQPGTWTLGTPGLNGAVVPTSLGGIIPWANPSSGNAYLAKLSVSCGAAIVGFMLYDLLWYNTGIVVATTTIQGITTPAFPARDIAGSTNGDGITMWLMATTATTNASAITNTTLNYTNQAGTTGRSAGLIYAWPATAVAGTMVPFALQGSDTGVRAITSASSGGITLGTSYAGGAVTLMAIRRVADVYLPSVTSGAVLDAFDVGMPQLYNDSNLYMAVLLSTTAAGATNGSISFSHG